MQIHTIITLLSYRVAMLILGNSHVLTMVRFECSEHFTVDSFSGALRILETNLWLEIELPNFIPYVVRGFRVFLKLILLPGEKNTWKFLSNHMLKIS